MTYTVVELERWEYERAHDVGIRRYTANWERRDAPWYDKDRMEDDRTAQAAAAICELAVAKHLNVYWPGHVWAAADHGRFRHLPDLFPNIEVRRVRSKPGKAAVRAHQVGKGLMLWVGRVEVPEMRRVLLLGHLDYDQAWQAGTPAPYDPDGTRLVDEAWLLREDG